MAFCVARALQREGVRAVLTGGACASIYTRGAYQSVDLDFVLQGLVPPKSLDRAMKTIGFARRGNQYFHASARFYVEFPPGPLAIGSDYDIRPVTRRIGGAGIFLLSATDSCRDRLAAYLHWDDRQGLETAIAIALRSRIDLAAIHDWSVREGALAQFEKFLAGLDRARRQRRSRRRRSPTPLRGARSLQR